MALLKSVGKKLAEKATEGALASVSKQARAIGKKSDVIPPPFERAPAKTKEEIDAIARRVAPQLTGEFVRLDPTKSINPAGLSKKRFDIEKELEHDIRPVREVAPPSIFDYESNLGKVQLGVFGDPTISQQDIYSIAGRKLPTPSRQYGGPRYPMYEPEDAWASNFGAASGLQSSAERASKQYGGADVVGLYTKMGKDSYDFAQHLSDALMKNIMISLPDMNKKQIAGFNKMVRNNPDAKDFAGIENPDIALAQMEKNPEMRKQFSMLATTPTYTKAFNMPNGLDVVNAVLEPDLRNLERGMTGYTTIELDPNVTHLHATDRASTTTYDTRIPRKEGAEVQQLEALAPYDLQYPDQLLAISKNPKQAPQPFGTLMMSGARQIIDPQHIDEIGLYRDFIKKYTGKKKGGSVEKDPEQIRDMIKSILGSDVQKAEGGTIADDAEEYGEQLKEQRKTLGSDILKSGAKGITEGVGNILRSAKETLSRAGTLGDIAKIPVDPLLGKMQYEAVTGKKFPELKPISLLPEQSITESPVGAKILPFTTEGQQFAGEVLGDPLSYSVSGAGRGIKKAGKFLAEGLAEAEATGKGPVGKVMQTIVPRFNVVKDPGGMLVGGEKELDLQLFKMKKPATERYTDNQGDFVYDPHEVLVNKWIDTKVRKYIRNQAGTEADPILKAIESGVEHNFQPRMGDSKYSQKIKRAYVGKPEEGIAKTDLGKEWEYTVDSVFRPTTTKTVKDILDDPNISDTRKQSKIRMETDLPVYTDTDYEAIKLVKDIPDEYLYELTGDNVGHKFGFDHVADVLREDLRAGKLTMQQMEQMSVEKAVRRAAEYDAEKAKAMAKANASSVEGMPIPKQYDDGYKWVELKHDTDPKRTEKALKSEGEMMGHCVGGYCPDVESGDIKIYSLRGPDGKSHVTIEARPQFSMTLWRNSNMDLISRDPELMKLDVNMRSLDDDHKYGRQMTERDYVREMTKEMKKRNINPVEPPSYMELHQVKGKQNKRPDEKYQNYISDFVKNNPTKHEIVLVEELQNTNLMNVQDVVDDGIVSKTLHNNPEIDKILKIKHAGEYRPDMPNIPKSFSRAEELRYDLFKEAARDLARQNKSFIDKDDILNHLKEKYLTPPKKAKGGSINLNQEYKLENMRRRYG
jgi:hypothetical protein